MAGLDDDAVLGLVALGEFGGEEVTGRSTDHVTCAGDTGTVGECLVGCQILAVDRFDAEHHVRRRRQHVGDRFERPIEHAPVSTVPMIDALRRSELVDFAVAGG